MKATDGTRLYSTLPKFENARTWAEIDLGALKENFEYLQGIINLQADEAGVKRPEPICVVKADAYGHGARGVVPTLLASGCRFFAVSSAEEAAEIRNICRIRRYSANILVLGVVPTQLAEVLASYDIITTVPSLEYAKRLSLAAREAGVRIRVHVKLDTGMNRLGFPAHDKESIEKTACEIAECANLGGISVEGMFTHFAEADDGSSQELAGANLRQAERFFEVSKLLEYRGISISFYHMCNTAASLRFPNLALDGVRMGISLYGAAPSEEFELPLRPVMSLKTEIYHVHTLPAGEKLGYGGCFSADTDRVIATLPIGYADGFLRAYGGAFVRVDSKKGSFNAPIVGRICMDQCMIDVTDGLEYLPEAGDEVTLFGDDQKRLCELARLGDTIPYEVLCAVSSRVIRLYK